MNPEYFSQIFQASPIPTTVLTGTYPDIIIQEANAAYIELTGVSREEIIGQPFFLPVPYPAMMLNEDGFADVQASIKKVFIEKAVVKTPVQKFLKPIPESEELETLYFEATNTPVFTPDGEVAFIIRSLQNITDVFVVGEKLRVSRHRLETIIQTVDGVVFESDALTLDLKFVSEQSIELLGYTPDECTQPSFFLNKILHPEDRDLMLRHGFELINLEKHLTGDFRIYKKDGTLKWIKSSVAVIYENESPRWLRGQMIDITESKLLSELESIEKAVLELNAEPSATTIEVLNTYLKGVESIFPDMRCAIMEVRDGYLYHWVGSSLPLEFQRATDHLPIKDKTGSCGTAAYLGQRIIASDIATDPRWTSFKDIALRNDLRSCWSQPVSNTAGEVIATLGMYYNSVRTPTEDELKVVDRTVHIIQVILQNRRNHEDLIASESRLRSLVDSQTNYVIRIDLNGNYTYTNKKYKEDFGLPYGQSLVGTDSTLSLIPGQLQPLQNVSKKCIEHPNEVFEIELAKYGSDGNIKHSFWHLVALTHSQGEPQEIQCIGIDISDLKQAQKDQENKKIELAESQKRYSDLFQLSPQPMWVYDPDTLLFLDVNDAAVEHYGYSREEFLRMTIKDIRPEWALPELEPSNSPLVGKASIFQGVFTHQLKNGEIIKVEAKRNQIPFNGKKAFLVLANNITEPVKYLEALEKQNARLADIAWLQSHVVRAPLTRIIGLVDVLQNFSDDPQEQDFVLKAIVSSAAELDGVVTDIVRKAEQVKPGSIKRS